jgi:hypothetical protein
MIDQRTFTFPFEDEDWSSKFLVGSLLYLIAPFLFGVPLLVLQGYALHIWRDAAAGRPPRLPAWDDWGEMGLRGLAYYAIILLYSLPLWLLGMVAVVISVGGGLALASMATGLETGDASAGWVTLAALMLAVGLGMLALVGLVVGVFIGLLSPVAVSRYVKAGRLDAAFEFGAVWRAVRANLGGLVVARIIVLIVSLALGSIVGTVGAIPCFGGFFVYLFMAPVGFYLSLVRARLMGQAYHEAQRRLSGAPTASVETPPAEAMVAVSQPVEKRLETAAKEPTVELPLETLELPARVLHVLHGSGFTTVGQVLEQLARGDAALLSIRGLGDKALAEIKAQLAAHGYLDEPASKDG